MSNVVINVDTSNKTVSVSVDGKAVENVSDISVYSELTGYFGVDIGIREEMGDLKKVTRLIASEKEHVNAKESEEFKGFKVVDDSLVQEISKFFSNRR